MVSEFADSALPHAECLPRDLRHYTLQTLLGGGGEGKVYLAWDRRLKREVAIKCAHSTRSAQRRHLQEARMGARWRHPAFVHVYEAWEEDGHSVLVMERVQGMTLDERVLRQRMGLPELIDLLRQTCEAVAELHRAGVVHGDLKATNLMVEAGGRLRVLDFGMARCIDPDRSLYNLDLPSGGTLRFMAPEVLRGGLPTPRADIYALGLLLGMLLRLVPADEPGRAELELLGRQMSSSEPEERPAELGLVLAALRAIEALRVQPLPPTALARPRSSGHGRFWVASLLASGLLVGGLVLWRQQGSLLGGSAVWGAALPPNPATLTTELDEVEDWLRQRYDEASVREQAVAQLEAVLRRAPEHARAAALLALAHSISYAADDPDLGWLQRAESSVQRALQADEHLALAHAVLARLRYQQGRLDDAETALNRALRLDPADYEALSLRGQVLKARGQREAAQQAFEAALQRYPQDRQLVNRLGSLHWQANRLDEAERLFRQNIAQHPAGASAYANLAAVLRQRDRADDALAVLQRGLQVQPNDRLYTNLGVLLYEQARYAESAQAFERAISGPGGKPNEALNWANWADALRWVPGQDEAAARAYRRALQLLEGKAHPDATDLSRMALYAARLRDPRASAWMSQALAQQPDSSAMAYRAVLVQEALGQREAALQSLALALRLGQPRHLVEAEPELQALRRDRRYHDLLSQADTAPTSAP
ncbi:protein kinase [Inhella sp.]|uniref:protein kinase domain-containing protein n=1 Tax=Inhella sp. TaxID=1921806 RepID=UPI0035AE50D2